MKWFISIKTLEELKAQYKKLAMQHHPDRGGKVADMQSINGEYDALFEKVKNIHSNKDCKTYTTDCDTTETASEFKNIIDRLIKLAGIHIEICGSWVWVTGCTINYKDELKALNFKWNKSKVAWYYHNDGYKKSTGRTYTLDEIRDLYGSKEVNTPPQLKLQII